jgi:hypothetical protein
MKPAGIRGQGSSAKVALCIVIKQPTFVSRQ